MKELYETGEKLTSSKLSSNKNVREGSVVIEQSDIVLNLIYKNEKKFTQMGSELILNLWLWI